MIRTIALFYLLRTSHVPHFPLTRLILLRRGLLFRLFCASATHSHAGSAPVFSQPCRTRSSALLEFEVLTCGHLVYSLRYWTTWSFPTEDHDDDDGPADLVDIKHRLDIYARPTLELEAQHLPLMSVSACLAYCTALSCISPFQTCRLSNAICPDPVQPIVMA